TYNGGIDIYVAYSTGTGWSSPVGITTDSSWSTCTPDDGCAYHPNFTVGDVSGEGRGDLGTGHGNVYVATAARPRQPASIFTSSGAAITIVQKPLTDASAYAQDNDGVWPVRDLRLQGPLYVVSSVLASDGIDGSRTTNYFYRGGKVHMKGGGFLGFRKIEM